MSNLTHKEPREDLAKKRREYLWRTALSRILIPGWSLFAALMGAALFIGFCAVIALLLGEISTFLRLAYYTAASAVSCYFSARILGVIHDITGTMLFEDVEHVPPVAEQIAALPAEEVLVRGSAQLAAMPEELLRAAQAGTVEPAEELLRAEKWKA